MWEITVEGRSALGGAEQSGEKIDKAQIRSVVTGLADRAWIRGFATGLACAMEVSHDEQGAAYAMVCARLTPSDLVKAGVTESEVETLRKAFKKHGRSWT